MFTDDVQTSQSTLTPGTSAFIGLKVVKEEDKIMEKEQAFYHSGVGMYLTKHSRPDITNAVRDLSKSMDGASKLQL